ncbi:MAG: hypothetical protein NVS9B12_12640 [Vulcanimicrobiaceae bacterium]
MKRFSAFALAALFALALAPAVAKTSSSQMMMPSCKGHMVMADMTSHRYSRNTNYKVSHHKMMMMCEAAAKSRGYHMAGSSMMMGSHSKMMAHPKMMGTPIPNPNGALNADKGATPNPDNNANGVHTTANPAPTPTPAT